MVGIQIMPAWSRRMGPEEREGVPIVRQCAGRRIALHIQELEELGGEAIGLRLRSGLGHGRFTRRKKRRWEAAALFR